MDLCPGSIYMQQAPVNHACFAGEWSQGDQPGKRKFAEHLMCACVYVLASRASALTEAVSTQCIGELDISRSIKVYKP